VIHEVLVVGGGPSGAVLATLLARRSIDVTLLEGSPAWRWRACGVFGSPAAMTALRRVSADDLDLPAVARPIPGMQVETRHGVTFRLTYGGDGSIQSSAVGFDRAGLDHGLLARAREAGVDVRVGARVERVELPRVASTVSAAAASAVPKVVIHGAADPIEARIVVGADGLRSVVAQGAGVVARRSLARRVGLTFHVPDPFGTQPHDARMVVIRDGYIGLAPVPGSRLNVGIVLCRSWRGELRRRGATAVAREVVEALPAGSDPPPTWHPLDAVAGASPVSHRVARRAGSGWLLVGDAAGFLDPFTGEGLHRAIVSAELAADAVAQALSAGRPDPLLAYDRAIEASFGGKDLVTQVVQAFLGVPPAFEYAARRLASRPELRETLGLVIGDLLPAARALDPRYLTALLRP